MAGIVERFADSDTGTGFTPRREAVRDPRLRSRCSRRQDGRNIVGIGWVAADYGRDLMNDRLPDYRATQSAATLKAWNSAQHSAVSSGLPGYSEHGCNAA